MTSISTKLAAPLILAAALLCPVRGAAIDIHAPEPGTDPFYKKEASVSGIKIRSSDKVKDAAFEAAEAVIKRMTRRSVIHSRLVSGKITVDIIAVSEVTTDLPENRYLKGTKTFDGRDWDTGTRGIGGTRENPSTSVGEENLLKLPGDRFAGEDILTHEFSHSVYLVALTAAERKLVQTAYALARKSGVWGEKTYAMANAEEYFAVGSQAYFDAGPASNAATNNGIATRAQLKKADPILERQLSIIYDPNLK